MVRSPGGSCNGTACTWKSKSCAQCGIRHISRRGMTSVTVWTDAPPELINWGRETFNSFPLLFPLASWLKNAFVYNAPCSSDDASIMRQLLIILFPPFISSQSVTLLLSASHAPCLSPPPLNKPSVCLTCSTFFSINRDTSGRETPTNSSSSQYVDGHTFNHLPGGSRPIKPQSIVDYI